MSDYERRNELAQERGYDSYYYERQARDFAREMGATGADIGEYAYLFDNYAEGDMSVDEWMEAYADIHGIDVDDIDMDDFYDWMQEFYESN